MTTIERIIWAVDWLDAWRYEHRRLCGDALILVAGSCVGVGLLSPERRWLIMLALLILVGLAWLRRSDRELEELEYRLMQFRRKGIR